MKDRNLSLTLKTGKKNTLIISFEKLLFELPFDVDFIVFSH